MKILHVIPSVDPRDGGPPEGLRQTSLLMAEQGHTIEVATLDAPGSDFLADYPFPVHPQGIWIPRYGYTPKLARWIVENADRFDAAVVHGLWRHSSVGGWQGLRRAGLPYVVFPHGMMDPWFREAYPLKHWAKQMVWLAGQGQVLRDAATVLFTAEEERRLASGVFRGFDYHETVVAYGTSEPPAASKEQAEAFHALVPSLAGRRYLLFLSRIHKKKGCDLLIQAFASIAAREPGLDLVIAGPDADGLTPRLRSLAERAGVADRIHWPGMLKGDAKWGAFRGAEAFVLPSHQENFGIVVAEAMACGTPALISDKINIWREVERTEGGFVRPDTLEGTTDLLAFWLSLSPDRKARTRIAARAGFERHFHIDAAARSLLAVLETVVRRRSIQQAHRSHA